ncbi:membrane protein, partial [Actinotalea ferrariae CF5-4]
PPGPPAATPAIPDRASAATTGAPAGLPPTEPLAVVSLVAAVLGLTALPGLGSVVGVVAGHVALRRVRSSGGGGEALAKGGLVVGYIGIGIVGAVLVGLLFTLAVARGGA